MNWALRICDFAAPESEENDSSFRGEGDEEKPDVPDSDLAHPGNSKKKFWRIASEDSFQEEDEEEENEADEFGESGDDDDDDDDLGTLTSDNDVSRRSSNQSDCFSTSSRSSSRQTLLPHTRCCIRLRTEVWFTWDLG